MQSIEKGKSLRKRGINGFTPASFLCSKTNAKTARFAYDKPVFIHPFSQIGLPARYRALYYL